MITFCDQEQKKVKTERGQVFSLLEPIPKEFPTFDKSIGDLPPPEEGNTHAITEISKSQKGDVPVKP